MKTTFSRTLIPAAIILLAALLLVGTGFQLLVRSYIDDHTIEGLKKDGDAISSLASAYYIEGSMSDRSFLTNLSVISQVTDADAVICGGAEAPIMEISVAGWNLLARDLGSANGTVLVRAGMPPVLLASTLPTPLIVGDLLVLGDGVTLRVDPPL